ncbi:thiamine pyrophosphate-dependent enzyme [Saccharopolyspora phatthalungensis]|uniref:Acetolactate synthase-1/2/3 large subunit n=1 Tax=Saccharopolyspora phatthalungensis TaxID=664693 RepID=A0A840QJ31_9PSEU|nr:thiamine pyrophosphate-dependent enzyme [Saccharopolyspora phatthalungensis]MBB5158859.1 acetolactate synthase-1/2/3 large subunit [Saccharopolyspora phatthalungensis]
MGTTVAANLVGTLREHGVRRVFGVPSESFTTFMDAMLDDPGLEFVAARHEGGAAFMAEAHAVAGGGVGVVMGGRAVGAANLSIGVHTARENSTPLLVLVGQMNSAHRGREGFQETDLADFLAPLAKHAVEESDPRRVPAAVGRALTIARSGRPGPVVVSLPEDVFAAEVDAPPCRPAPIPRPAPAPGEAQAFHEAFAAAQRPLIIAGAGVQRSGAEAALLAFAERWNVPVMAAWRRHDAFPNEHPLYVGHLQMGTHPELVDTVRQADMIVALGARLNEITTQGYTAISPSQRIVQVDIEPSMIGKTHPVELAIVADVATALETFAGPEAPRAAQWARRRRAVYERVTSVEVDLHEDRVDNRQIIRVLQENLRDDAVLTNDAGNFAGWMHTFFRFRRPHTYVGAASGAMGYALPAAIGAALARPDQVVVSLSGDGGFMMTVQELETAVRLGVPIISLVFNNNMYGSIRMHQERQYPAREIGSALGNPDLVALAKSFGAFGVRVTADAEFAPALQAALAEYRPAVIEIRTDPEQISVWQTITQLREGR